jgi:hypothetical protein
MNNSLLKAFAVIATLALTSFAQAEVDATTWKCELQVNDMHGWSVAVGPAASFTRGEGVVYCISDEAVRTATPVRVKVLGGGMGLGVAHFKSLNMKVAAAGLARTSDMFGRLMFAQKIAVTTFKKSYSAGSYVTLNKWGASVGVEFSKFQATGLAVGAMLEGISIKPIGDTETAE